MAVKRCPPAHKHAATGTCWTHHGCRCTRCSKRESSRVNLAYTVERALSGKNRLIATLGATRRLRALAYLGWTCPALAEITGIDVMHLNEIRAAKRPTLHLRTHARIDKAFKELQVTQSPRRGSGVARALAKRNGWAPAAAWDQIDDPKELPKLGRAKRGAKHSSSAQQLQGEQA